MVPSVYFSNHEHHDRDFWRSLAQWRIPLAVLSFLFVVQTAFADGKVEIEINDTPESSDDYICWSPAPARIRIMGVSADVPVTLSSKVRQARQLNDEVWFDGEVWFAPFSGSRPTSANFNPVDTLAVTLPKDGNWVSFWVAGKTASTDGQDTAIIAFDSDGKELSRTVLMVRIRKNAVSLKKPEIKYLLQALATLHDVDYQGQKSEYLKYVKVHSDAFAGSIHQAPAFLPWHRTFILSLERDLQTIDPRVALPYWKFDEDAPDLFVKTFLGEIEGASARVTFADGNPLVSWRMPANSAIEGWQEGNPPPQSSEEFQRFASGGHPKMSIDLSNLKEFRLMRVNLEEIYHNRAHKHIGGWLLSPEAPKDPLFFFLHANVDRIWAQWQKDNRLFGETDLNSYWPQGAYPGKGYLDDPHQGAYADDTQWPWNLKGGDQDTPDDENDNWPDFVFPFPASQTHGPSAKPTTREVIDYQDADGSGKPLNYSYDTIPFKN